MLVEEYYYLTEAEIEVLVRVSSDKNRRVVISNNNSGGTVLGQKFESRGENQHFINILLKNHSSITQ